MSAAKAVLRKQIKEKLMKLSHDEKHRQSLCVYNKLVNSSSFRRAKRICIYLSTDLEVDTIKILQKMFEMEKDCYVPRYSSSMMEMVKLHDMNDYHNLPKTKWNIKQPALDEKRDNALETGGLDVMIVPGVGFTAAGERLGHGGGYYDKYFQQLEERKMYPHTIGLAFKEQIFGTLPLEKSDRKIETVLFCE